MVPEREHVPKELSRTEGDAAGGWARTRGPPKGLVYFTGGFLGLPHLMFII